MMRICDDVDNGDGNGDDEEGRDACKCGDYGEDNNDYGYDYEADADDDDVGSMMMAVIRPEVTIRMTTMMRMGIGEMNNYVDR
jgi:hypothetical protein